MKTLIFNLVLFVWAGAVSAQGIVELNETTVSFAPNASHITNSGNKYFYNVSETYTGEFEKDPLAFMEKNFDVDRFILELKDKDMDSYQVSFVTLKGFLKVDFDREGKVVKTYQRFRNIKLPNALSHEIYRDYKGWNILRNLYVAKGRNGNIDKEFYRLKLENGNKIQNIKIDRTEVAPIELASN
ncbi:hypothetical protein RM549_03425 [Salegentibacter sp. F188]|uniref:Nicotinate-nucleotide adenylyltransferase n=1 Tax=Autumnicola patrickiae TaxID=3075591 RepID=A0ABU3DYP3_9FLAO|nr:hypothetical protein [Salegentibacter sp. F188]MDT0688817.1 hypothetical protein [Salegentibacter sp. F188]